MIVCHGLRVCDNIFSSSQVDLYLLPVAPGSAFKSEAFSPRRFTTTGSIAGNSGCKPISGQSLPYFPSGKMIQNHLLLVLLVPLVAASYYEYPMNPVMMGNKRHTKYRQVNMTIKCFILEEFSVACLFCGKILVIKFIFLQISIKLPIQRVTRICFAQIRIYGPNSAYFIFILSC
jgi:hypothetical protein